MRAHIWIRLLLASVSAAAIPLVFTGVGGAVTPPASGTYFHVQSEPGDPIGRGEELLYTTENAGFTMWYINGYFEARIQGTDGNFWNIHMQAPDALVPGTTYRNVTLWPYNNGVAGLSVSGFATACSWLGSASEMTINELSVRPIFPNEIERFDATFVQYCNDSAAPLRGHVHYEIPPDTTPPTIYVPGDMQVEALDANGASVYYGVFASDDRDGYVTPNCTPESGALFPIGTTTVVCTATDLSGNSASGQFAVTVLSPFELGLTLGASGKVDVTSGSATVSGVVTCNRPATVYVTATVSQVVARRATLQGTTQVPVDCTAPSTAWSATVVAPTGSFLPGRGMVDASAFACPYYCHNAAASRSVTLKG
jgi:HYR domain